MTIHARHIRHGWLWRLLHTGRPAFVAPTEHAGATAKWSPKETWDTVADTAPEETAEERAERMLAETKAVREREEAETLAKFADIVRAEFDAAFKKAGIDQQIERVGDAADAALKVMCSRWKIPISELRRDSGRRANRFYRRLVGLLKSEQDPAAVSRRWAAAILEPTGPLPTIQPRPRQRELVGAR